MFDLNLIIVKLVWSKFDRFDLFSTALCFPFSAYTPSTRTLSHGLIKGFYVRSQFDEVQTNIKQLEHRSNHISNRTNQNIFAIRFDYCSIRLGNQTPIVWLSSIEFYDLIKKIGSIGFGWHLVWNNRYQTIMLKD